MYICFGVYIYIYVSGVCVYNYVSGAGVYMLFVGGYVCVCCSPFVLNLFDFKILCLSCYFAKKNWGGHFQDSQISLRTARFLN